VRALVEQARAVYAGDAAATAVIDGLASRLDEPLRVAIAGRVKSGKSTLVNALVGEPLAPTDAGQCTQAVTWYRHGRSYAAFVQRREGAGLERAGLRRLASAVDVEPGDWTASDLERIVIEWPAAALASLTLIDTPGLGSLTPEVGERTAAFLAPEENGSPADAVVYLARHLHGADLRLLEAFRDDDAGAANPIHTIGVVSRADEIGVARVDAMDAAARVAERYRSDPRLRRLCLTVVPVDGLLALGAAQLAESDFRALARLAAETGAAADLSLSADRFTAGGDVEGVTVDERRRLLELIGLFGVRLSCALLREGIATTSGQLAAELRRRSGIEELRALLTTQLAARSDVLKARAALTTLERVARRFPPADGARLVTELERVEADAHELAEMRLLVALRAGGADLRDGDMAEAERLLERSGMPVRERLDLDDDARDQDVRALLSDRAGHWRRRAEHPFATREAIDAARIVLRSYEGMLLELPPAGGPAYGLGGS
jgi:hypothetical protein